MPGVQCPYCHTFVNIAPAAISSALTVNLLFKLTNKAI